MSNMGNIQGELSRIRRVSDMLVSAHSDLRDIYHRKSMALDIAILGCSIWLIAMAFVDPTISKKLIPFDIEAVIWIGILAIITFFLSLVQLKVNWKERNGLHSRAGQFYASIKNESGYLLAQGDKILPEMYSRLQKKYDMAGEICIPIPESKFLRQKQKHKIKVAISKHLDDYPATNILYLRLKMWWRDNFISYENERERDGRDDKQY